jgi:hypothetical protein
VTEHGSQRCIITKRGFCILEIYEMLLNAFFVEAFELKGVPVAGQAVIFGTPGSSS